MNYMSIALVALGVALMAGVVKSEPDKPCTVNDDLMAMVRDQQKKITDMMVEAKHEADTMKKKFESKLDELEQAGCKK